MAGRSLDALADDGEEFDRDTVFDLLSNARRRYILRRICESSVPIHIKEFARGIASEETGTPPKELENGDIRRVYVSLYQTHLPKLDDCGLVAFDSNEGLVRRDAPEDRYRVICGLLGDRQEGRTTSALVFGVWAVASLLVLALLVDRATGPFELAAVALLVVLSNLLVAMWLFPTADVLPVRFERVR